MHFEAGPWHCFGEELLKLLMDVKNENGNRTLAVLMCNHTFLENNVSLSKWNTVKRSITGGSSDSRCFIPDFTAIVKDEYCIYLEITSKAYLSAFRATLIQNNAIRFSFYFHLLILDILALHVIR